MSESNLPNNNIVLYQEKGLSEKEAKTLDEYIEAGKPGLSKIRADSMLTLFNLGYSCEDIQKMVPEYNLGSILHARFTYGWDEAKMLFQNQVNQELIKTTNAVKADSVKFMNELIMATHVKHRRDIARYLANPEKEDPPKCIPASLSQYQSVVTSLRDMTEPKDNKGAAVGNTLVSVVVNTSDPSDKKDIKTILRKKAEAVKESQKK